MKFAVVLDQLITAGGGFQQALSTATLIRDLYQEKKLPWNYHPVFYVAHKESKDALEEYGIKSSIIKHSIIDAFISFIRQERLWSKILRKFLPNIFVMDNLNQLFEKDGIDFVFFTSPSKLALELERLNFSITVWDLCHLDHPEFPEVRNDGEFERREFFYSRVLRKASSVIVESEFLKEKVIFYYRVAGDRILVAPFEVPIFSTDIPSRGSTPTAGNQFLFYPAQYWPHKNHVYVLDALSILEKSGVSCEAVFCGSDKGHLKVLTQYAKELGVQHLVHFETFLPRARVEKYYMDCLAVVMPTFFGPSNLPPLEAMLVGKPIFYSDLEELQGVFPGCTIPINLKSSQDLADKVKPLITDSKYYGNTCDTGASFLKKLGRENNYSAVIVNVLSKSKDVFHAIRPEPRPSKETSEEFS